jgi:hypothetical protein
VYFWINSYTLKAVFRRSVMSESFRVSEKKSEAAKEDRTSQTRKSNYSQPANSSVDRILFLQRTIGNQAVARLIKSGALQTKLRIGQLGDKYEEEADKVAEQVMRVPGVSRNTEDVRIQQKCPKCEEEIQRKPLKSLQADDQGYASEVTPEVESDINSLKGGGQPLPESVRVFFEPRFGHDFSRVRVHADAKAVEATQAVNATAYIRGQDEVFGAGQYAPRTTEGSRVIAHELTNVVQQSHNIFDAGATLRLGFSDNVYERQADSFATARGFQPRVVMRNNAVEGLLLQRQDTDSDTQTDTDEAKSKGNCSFLEKNRKSFAISIATHFYLTELGGEGVMIGPPECDEVDPDVCTATYTDGLKVTIYMIEIPNSVAAASGDKWCEYTYLCPKGKGIIYTKRQCSKIGGNSGALQTKLRIGQTNDIYEQEAERVAEQVMRMPAPVQTKCTKYEEGIQKKSLKTLQGSDNEVKPEIESDINSLIGSGDLLPESSRAFFEPRFRYDFSRVRVHTDARAAESARAVNALAYTVGTNVVFGLGQYAPATLGGRRLLAHELTHTIQQEAKAPTAAQRLTSIIHEDAGERQVRAASDAVALGTTVPIVSQSVQQLARQDDDENGGSPDASAQVNGVDQALPLNQGHGELPGSPGACVVQSAIPFSRSGIKRTPTGNVFEDFEVRVEWSSAKHREASYCAAECGEYHQFIKGYMRSSPNQDGSGLIDVSGKVFDGKPLDQNVFQEDGLNNNPKARYGHRDEEQTMNEKYEPDRATGTKYVGKDSPGVFIGTFADFDVTFVGKLVDTCNGTETVSDPWRVFYRGVIRP